MTLHYIHVTTSDNDHNPERVRMMMLKITNISSIIVTLQKNILSLSLGLFRSRLVIDHQLPADCRNFASSTQPHGLSKKKQKWP